MDLPTAYQLYARLLPLPSAIAACEYSSPGLGETPLCVVRCLMVNRGMTHLCGVTGGQLGGRAAEWPVLREARLYSLSLVPGSAGHNSTRGVIS